MKVQTGKINFKSIDTSRVQGIGTIHIPDRKILERISQNVDVKLSSVNKSFPYRNTSMSISSIKITARPKGLNFIEKLFGYRTVVDYYPFGNLKPIIKFKFKGSFEDFLKKTIAKVK